MSENKAVSASAGPPAPAPHHEAPNAENVASGELCPGCGEPISLHSWKPTRVREWWKDGKPGHLSCPAPAVSLPPVNVKSLPHLADSLSQVTGAADRGPLSSNVEEKQEVCAPDFGGEGGVREIGARDLVLRALRNLRPRDRRERWSAVSYGFGLGSTYSIELCRNFGLDPHEKIGGDDQEDA